MDSLAVGFLGALVGGTLGLGGAWLVARGALNSTRMTEQRALITAERTRLETLYGPLTEFVWALDQVVAEQSALWSNETPEERLKRHDSLLKERSAQLTKVTARLYLEPGSDVLDVKVRELWIAFTQHMAKLIREPDVAYQPDQQSALNIQAQIRSVLTDLQSQIAALDREAATVVGRGSARRRLPWRHR